MSSHPSFQIEITPDNFAIITFDLLNEKVNKFSSIVLNELQSVIQELKSKSSIKGALFRSNKKDIFIAGADIIELSSIKNESEGRKLIEMGQNIFTEWSDLPFPTCAMINGACMGGGLEFSLCFDYRVVSDQPKTVLALPEVKLGIYPAWGGTQRLTRLVGAYYSIENICSGKNIYPKEAYEMGLVDDYSPQDDLQNRALAVLLMGISDSTWKIKREVLRNPLSLSDDQSLYTFGLARAYIMGETKGNYPAPIAALDAIQEGSSLPLKDGLQKEIEKVLPLITSDVAQNLMNIFFMSEELKKVRGSDVQGINPGEIKQVAVLGAGIMGGGIATANIYKDIPVIMKDVAEDRIKIGFDQAIDILGDRVKKNRMEQKEMDYKMALISGTLSDKPFQTVDLIIEAIIEDEKIKSQVFKSIQEYVRDNTIIASNTSTISIDKLSESVKHPENFIGLHFFNPVHKMPLVEVIRGKKTSDQTTVTVVNYAKKLGKTPIVVRNGSGFLVNRLLLPYLNEACQLLMEGVGLSNIEKVITRFGMPMGPFTLLDVVGIDTAKKAGEVLVNAFPDRIKQSEVLNALNKNNRWGQKNGKGFFKYPKGKKKGEPDETLMDSINPLIKKEKDLSKHEILERMMIPMILEATRVLEDGIASCVRDVDMGMIFGTGFPPFRGGLLRYADSLGISNILKICDKYHDLGMRYDPTQMILDMNKSNKTFYQY